MPVLIPKSWGSSITCIFSVIQTSRSNLTYSKDTARRSRYNCLNKCRRLNVETNSPSLHPIVPFFRGWRPAVASSAVIRNGDVISHISIALSRRECSWYALYAYIATIPHSLAKSYEETSIKLPLTELTMDHLWKRSDCELLYFVDPLKDWSRLTFCLRTSN